MQEQIFKEKKKNCPWRVKGYHFYDCRGSGQGHRNNLHRLQCTFKNCPIAFWVNEFVANGWL